MGNLDFAKKMIKVAAESGATYAKFQKWDPKVALSEEQYNKPHPNSLQSFGEPYGIHRENLEFSANQHLELKQYCEDQGIKYCSSVFDKVSAEIVVKLTPDFIKIPSQKNLKIDMYDTICKDFEGDIHISSGMTTGEQMDFLLEQIDKRNSLSRVVLYTTTSHYPCQYENLFLLRISEFRERYGDKVKGFGFSGHHNGISADVAAYTLGANFVERHFTLDRTLKGTDHAASLEPQGLAKLCRDLLHAHEALKVRPEKILDVEIEAFNKVKKSDWDTLLSSNS
jgi:sialic acid synthase